MRLSRYVCVRAAAAAAAAGGGGGRGGGGGGLYRHRLLAKDVVEVLLLSLLRGAPCAVLNSVGGLDIVDDIALPFHAHTTPPHPTPHIPHPIRAHNAPPHTNTHTVTQVHSLSEETDVQTKHYGAEEWW